MAKSMGFSLSGHGWPPPAKNGASCAGCSQNARRPWTRIVSWSKREMSSQVGWWIVQTMVRPVTLARDMTTSAMLSAAAASRPVVGSSRHMTEQFARRSMPMDTRFFWPPLMPGFSVDPTTTSALAWSPSCAMTSSARACFSPCVMSPAQRSSAVK